jgi:hypothetical protein
MTRRLRILAALVIGSVLASSAPTAQASDPWPAPYKTSAQIESEILAVETAHPDIVDVQSIGSSYEGRQLYVVKISDNVLIDEGEP